MKTIVFDLKNTLVTNDMILLEGVSEVLKLTDRTDLQRILYTMNEPWTYRALTQFEELFMTFDEVVLVSRKQQLNLENLKGEVLVVGDSATEELAFAEALGLSSIRIDGIMRVKEVQAWIGRSL